jgi:antigen flippase
MEAGTGAPPAGVGGPAPEDSGTAVTRPAAAERPSLAKHGAIGVLVSGAVLAGNLVTGVIAARVLGPDGRGVLTAVLVFPQTVGMAFTLGAAQTIAYHQSRDPSLAGRLMTTWAGNLAVSGIAAVGVGLLLVPTAFAAQSGHAQYLARLFLVTIVVVLLTELAYGVLLGDHDFGFFNLFKLLQPVSLAAVFAVLWLADAFTVESALAASAIIPALVLAVALRRVIRRHGLARPSSSLRWKTLRYGIQIHGTALTGLLTARLAMLVIPAVLSATLVGYYAVAFNMAAAVASLSTSLPLFLLPVAARSGERAPRIVVLSLHATVAVAVTVSLVLILVAEPAVTLVYGDEFQGSVAPLRLILVGTTFFIASNMLIVAMNALNRPFAGALAYLCGLAFTAIGLLLFLDSGGLEAAAAVSSAAGIVVFVMTLTLYRRFSGIAWKELLPTRSEIASIGRRVRGLIPGRRGTNGERSR